MDARVLCLDREEGRVVGVVKDIGNESEDEAEAEEDGPRGVVAIDCDENIIDFLTELDLFVCGSALHLG